jgi:hypothetical protein
MENIYGLSLREQEKFIDKYCFDECGKVYVSSIEILGEPYILCGLADCKYIESDADMKYQFDCYGKKKNLIIRTLKDMDE